jgi:hypothetical protein
MESGSSGRRPRVTDGEKFHEQHSGFCSYPMNVEESGCFRLPQINAAQED